MFSARGRSRYMVQIFVCLVLLFAPMPATAQSLPKTPPDQLALQLVEGNSYYFDPEIPSQELYSVQDGVIDPSLTSMTVSTRQQFTESGMIDQFVRTAGFQPDFVNSSLFPEGPSNLVLQVRVITFPSDQQAADYVNQAFANKSTELRESQSTVAPTDVKDVPWNDEAVSGYTIPEIATDTATGLNVEYLTVNYTGQQGQIVVMARISAPPDLAEPIAREMFYAQIACVQVDAPCGSFMVPVGEFPQTAAIESRHGGGSKSTSVGENGATAATNDVPASPAANASVPETATSGTLSAYNYQIETSGSWVVLPQLALSNNVLEAIPMRGTNDNFILASVTNLEGADRVVSVLSFLAPELGSPTLIEDGGTYMLHVVVVDGVAYGIFSTIEVASSALDSIVQIYMAPLSTFGVGLADLQASVLVNGSPALPNVDGDGLVPAFGTAPGDPAAEATLPPLIGG